MPVAELTHTGLAVSKGPWAGGAPTPLSGPPFAEGQPGFVHSTGLLTQHSSRVQGPEESHRVGLSDLGGPFPPNQWALFW